MKQLLEKTNTVLCGYCYVIKYFLQDLQQQKTYTSDGRQTTILQTVIMNTNMPHDKSVKYLMST